MQHAGAMCFLGALFSLEHYTGIKNFPSGFTISYKGCVSAACAANAAWLTVASAIGIVMLAPESEEAVWLGILVVGAAADFGLFVLYQTKSVSYALTLVWAYTAVFFATSSPPIVQAVAVLCAVIYSALAALIVFKRLGSRGSSAGNSNGQADALMDSAV